MVRTISIPYLQSLSLPRTMDWDLVQEQDGITAGTMLHNNARPCGTRQMVAHFPGLRHSTFPVNENPKPANTLIRRFMAADGAFPAKDFRATG